MLKLKKHLWNANKQRTKLLASEIKIKAQIDQLKNKVVYFYAMRDS